MPTFSLRARKPLPTQWRAFATVASRSIIPIVTSVRIRSRDPPPRDLYRGSCFSWARRSWNAMSSPAFAAGFPARVASRASAKSRFVPNSRPRTPATSVSRERTIVSRVSFVTEFGHALP